MGAGQPIRVSEVVETYLVGHLLNLLKRSRRHAYRTRSGSDGMLPLNFESRIRSLRSRFCNVPPW